MNKRRVQNSENKTNKENRNDGINERNSTMEN